MTAPTKQVRADTYLRDNHRCINCGTTEGLSWQHRESSGHGGRGKKAPPLTTADGVTLCLPCNQACEAHMQTRALALGWKIRRNRGRIQSAQIPFYDCNTREWYLPTFGPTRDPIRATLAAELLAVAGNLLRETDKWPESDPSSHRYESAKR